MKETTQECTLNNIQHIKGNEIIDPRMDFSKRPEPSRRCFKDRCFFGIAIIFGYIVLAEGSRRGAKMDHLQILDGLLRKNYDRRATPTNQFNNATTVICELYIRSFGSISPVTMDYEVDVYLRQKWQDERLRHEQITEALDLNDPNLVKAIWIPEVYFPNAKNAEFQYVTVPNVLVRINPDGGILYMLRLKLTFSCMMDLTKFPLDSQICTMEVASFSKTTEELRLEWKPTNPVTMGKMRMPQFEIVDIMADECQESFQIGNYSCLVAEFYLSRSVGFHLVQSYLPTILIVVISWVSFWMDVNSVPGRTTLGVTTLLAVSSQSSGIQRGLPQVSYVKAIDVWMGTCTAFVFCALLEFTIVNYMWRRQPEMPKKKLNNMSKAADSGGAGTPTSANGDASTAPVKVCFPEESNPPPEYIQETSSSMELNHMRCTSAVQSHRSPETVPVFEGDLSHLDSRLPRLSQCRGSPLYSKVLARKIDEWSRLCFPLAFIAFNLFYWPYYMLA